MHQNTVYWVDIQLAQRKGLKFYQRKQKSNNSVCVTSTTTDEILILLEASKDTQRIELKPNIQLSSTRKPVTGWRKESLERTKFDRDTVNQDKNMMRAQIQRVRGNPSEHKSTKRCLLTPRQVENDQTSTGKM